MKAKSRKSCSANEEEEDVHLITFFQIFLKLFNFILSAEYITSSLIALIKAPDFIIVPLLIDLTLRYVKVVIFSNL